MVFLEIFFDIETNLLSGQTVHFRFESGTKSSYSTETF